MSVRASTGVALRLLGGQVRRGAEHGARLRRGLGAEHARDAEVHDLDRAVARDHDVAGLDVAVDHALCVRRRDRRRDLLRDLGRLNGGGLAAGRHELGEGAALDELHDDVLRVVVCAGVVHAHDVRLVQARGRLRLTAETVARSSCRVRTGAGAP